LLSFITKKGLMTPLRIKPLRQTPEIILDAEENIFSIFGKSAPEDAQEFYNSVLFWFQDYYKNPNTETVFEIKFVYYNTSSSKMILNIFNFLATQYEKGHSIKIKWHYPEDDEDLLEAGQEYAEIAEIPFEFIPY